jgi:hypothetical protein
MERDQPHKTPITSTWTVDFLTRVGEGHKVVGDWLRDIRVFSHTRLVCKNGANIQMGFVNYVNGAERWDSIYWGEDPIGTPPGIYRAVCVVSKFHRIQGRCVGILHVTHTRLVDGCVLDRGHR